MRDGTRAIACLVLALAWHLAPCMGEGAGEASGFRFVDQPDAGELALQESGRAVFSFVYGPRLAAGVAERYRRTGYLHPVHDPAGEPITMDFPADHRHHRGVWLSWPWMQVQGRDVQLWHPSPLRQHFARWIAQDIREDRAILAAEIDWMLDGERVGRECTTVTAYRAGERSRVLDLVYTFEAIGEPIRVRGQEVHGYGGVCVRTTQDLRGGRLHTSEGPLGGDVHAQSFAWAALASDRRGMAVFAHPENPGAPQAWLLRNSYGGILNPQWPGTEGTVLEPGDPVTLRYRLYVFLGEADPGHLAERYQEWVAPAPEAAK